MKNIKNVLLIILILITTFTFKIIAEENKFNLISFRNELFEWRNKNNLQELPDLVEIEPGIFAPKLTLKSSEYPNVYWYNNPMIGSTPFIVHVLKDNEVEKLLDYASDALIKHFSERPSKNDKGFKTACITDIYVLAIVETYRHSSLFGPTQEGSITFVFTMRENVKSEEDYFGNNLYDDYIPWPHGSIDFLVLERFPNGRYQVTREGAGG